MRSTTQSRGHLAVRLPSVAAGLLLLGATQAMAHGVTLCAEPYAQSLPGPVTVPMWGYRQVATAAGCDVDVGVGTTSPGPLITVPAGDTTLTVTLVNKLTVPTSIVLAGQALASDGGAPVLAADLVGAACVPSAAAAASAPEHPLNCRVRSFTGETDVGATRTYTFFNLRPGTYLYQSGTHPQVQVQMGLFGMARQDATLVGSTGRLLYANVNAGFDVDVPVVLSEIDADQHNRIAATLGGADPSSWKAGSHSTLNYAPRYFLVNGKVFESGNPGATELVAANAGSGARIVLRIANAGLQSRSLMLNSGTWSLLTEDGNAYAAAREQATALVPAGKTTDALVISTAPADGSISRSLAVFDRRGGTDNADGTALGGQVARLAQSGPPVPYIAGIGNQVANEGSTFTLQVAGINITNYQVSGPVGMTIAATTGLITWPVPTGTAVPTDAAVTVSGTGNLPPPATRSFSVRINHTPTIAQSGPVAVAHGTVTVPAAGVLAGATDPDGDTLTAVQTGAVSSGALTLNADGSYSWTGPQPLTGTTAVTFSAAARDALGLTSTPKTVTLNVAANVLPVAVNDSYTMTLARVPLINTLRSVNDALQIAAMTRPVSQLLGNDSDADGTVNAATIARVVPVPPLAGTISARRINPASPAGCTTNCATIAPPALGAQASVTMLANGNFVLVPHANLLTLPVLGTYEFRYTVRDDQSGLSNQAVVRVTVN